MLNQGFVAVRDQETEHAGFVCLKFMTDIFTSYLYLVYILNDELWIMNDRPWQSCPGTCIRTGLQVSHKDWWMMKS